MFLLDVKTRRNMYILTLKGQCQNLTSGQGHVRSRVTPSRSYQGGQIQKIRWGRKPNRENFYILKNRNHIYKTMLLLSNHWPSNISISFKDIYSKITTDTYIIPFSLRMHTRPIDPESRLFRIESSSGFFYTSLNQRSASYLLYILYPWDVTFFPTSYPVTEN